MQQLSAIIALWLWGEHPLQEPGQPLAQAEGSAEFRDHIAMLTVKLDLTRLSPGLYLMEIRQSGLSWSQYPVLLK